jgi:hypothetical protein
VVFFNEDLQLESIWDFIINDNTYQTVINVLKEYIYSKPISNVYITKDKKVGVNKNLERGKNGQVIEWHHFYLELPDKFITQSRDTVNTIKGEYQSIKDVFKRSLEELSVESTETVLELIYSNTLYKGEEWKVPLEKFLTYQKEYNDSSEFVKDNYVWHKSVEAGGAIGKIRNHSIGVLLTDITGGMDLDKAVKRYENIVAPSNYKRPKAIFTKKMLEDAKNTVQELGYMESLKRRFATLDDIRINNILFSNKDAAKRISGDVFAEMEGDIVIDSKKFSRVEEVPVEVFIEEVLPRAKEIEIFLENKQVNNMVSVIAPVNKDAPSMFKWNNGFSWAYSGNITDSSMKENVKMAGGNVEGVLRFSIQWNDKGVHDRNDLDAHCIEPSQEHISFSHMHSRTRGVLDVDITNPKNGVPAVENITWPIMLKMDKGIYKFFVHQYANRGGKDGFKAEIEFNNQIYSFEYNNELRQGENVQVAEVTLGENGFSIKELIPSTMATKEAWGLKTQQFVPVSVVMYSPNYWDEQEGIGHRHIFFMLKDCVNDEKPNGFYNEFLKQDLVKHKRVFEALGSKMRVTDVEDQLSGIGFSSTKRDELVVKIKGQTERIMKIKI